MQRVVAVMVLAVVAAACSGDDDAESGSTTTIAPVATTTAPSRTTAPPVATTAPTEVTTTLPATTAPPPATTEAPPATTEPPPTTIDPMGDLEASIARDAQAGEDTLFDVLTDPSTEDAEDRLREYFVDEALDSVLETLETFRRNDFIVEENPLVPDTVELTDDPQLIEGSDPSQVRVGTCRLDSAIVLAPVVDTDLRIPVDDKIYRTDAISTFVLVDGTWRLQGGTTLSESTGDVSCA